MSKVKSYLISDFIKCVATEQAKISQSYKTINEQTKLIRSLQLQIDDAAKIHKTQHEVAYFHKYLIDALNMHDDGKHSIFLVPEDVPTGMNMDELGFVKIEQDLRLVFNNITDYNARCSLSLKHVLIDEGAIIDILCLQDGFIHKGEALSDKQVNRLVDKEYSKFLYDGKIVVATRLFVYRLPSTQEERDRIREYIESFY